MKSNNKPKQSTNNKKRIVGDSNSRLVAGTFLGFMRTTASKIINPASFITTAPAIAIFVFTILGLPLCCGSTVFAEDSITVTIDNPNLNVNVAPKNANGTFAKSNDSTISVKTTNATGYTLGIKANDGANYDKLINGSEALSSITEATTEDQFKALAGTGYNGMWGYLPSKLNSSANTDFLPAPDAAGDIINVTECANGTTSCPNTEDTYTMAIGARVDISQTLGSYSNVYLVSATANAISYSIVYDDNVVSDMPEDINSGQAVSGNVAFSSNTPTRDGYTFLGWCTKAVATPASSSSDCTAAGGQYYAAGSTTTISAATAFHLYAMWEKADKTIQNFTLTDCRLLASGADYTVTDSRDGKDYTVRYINGACWMTQNLRYLGDTGSTSGSMIMKSATSNISTDTTITYYELKGAEGSSPSGHCYGNGSSGGNGYNYACTHMADSADVSDAGSSACNGNTCTIDQLGVWYNYAAVSAMTITGTSNSTVGTYSICPKGWTLPTGNSSAAGGINSIASHANSFNPIYGGTYDRGSHLAAATHGYWWSATPDSAYGHYYLLYYGGGLSTDGRYARYNVYYVRCVRTSD